MNKPLWSICIATLASRDAKFRALMDTLLPQVEKAGNVEVIGCHNNGEYPLGVIRQSLLMAAQGDYVSFLDDDDSIPAYFVAEIVPALLQGPDVVGFYMDYLEGGTFIANSYHSIKHEPHNKPTAFYRDVSHQQPVKRKLAQQGDFRVAWPEDNAWKTAVRPLLKTEVYIDRVLYYYTHDWSDSVQGNLAPHTYTPRPEIDCPAFRWLEELIV